MAYISNTPDDVRTMLDAIGLDSIDQLFDMIPPEYRLPFFDTPLGFALVVGLIALGFYVFVGKWKTPADYHRQGQEIQAQAQQQQQTGTKHTNNDHRRIRQRDRRVKRLHARVVPRGDVASDDEADGFQRENDA